MKMDCLGIIAVITILSLETIHTAPRKPRLTLAEPMPSYYHTDIGGVSGAYAFGYDVWDPATGNIQFRSEERYPNGTVRGSYGYVDALGEARSFKYVSDERGYRVRSDEKKHKYQSNSVNAEVVNTSTESSITWTRPSKKKTKLNKGNILQRRKYSNFQQPGYYLLY